MSLREWVKPCCEQHRYVFLAEKDKQLKSCSCATPIEWVMIRSNTRVIHSTATIHSGPLYDSFQSRVDFADTLHAEAVLNQQLKHLHTERLKI